MTNTTEEIEILEEQKRETENSVMEGLIQRRLEQLRAEELLEIRLERLGQRLQELREELRTTQDEERREKLEEELIEIATARNETLRHLVN